MSTADTKHGYPDAPEPMDVSPERAEDLRHSARMGGEANARVGLIIGIFLALYAAWVIISKLL